LAVIRRQAASSPPSGHAKADAASQGAQPTAARAQPRPLELRALIAQRLAAVPATDPDARTTRARVFVEQVLVHELGPAFRDSPQFKQTVKRVQRAMDGDPAMKAELDALLDSLVISSG
jgi:hypothetical protein